MIDYQLLLSYRADLKKIRPQLVIKVEKRWSPFITLGKEQGFYHPEPHKLGPSGFPLRLIKYLSICLVRTTSSGHAVVICFIMRMKT